MYFGTAMTNGDDVRVLQGRRYEVIKVSSNYAEVDIHKIINLGLLSFWVLGIILVLEIQNYKHVSIIRLKVWELFAQLAC
jgi:hypothetical protein